MTFYEKLIARSMAPRMQITWEVLEAAKDADDKMVISACRRIITADRIGWKKHGNRADLKLILEFRGDNGQ